MAKTAPEVVAAGFCTARSRRRFSHNLRTTEAPLRRLLVQLVRTGDGPPRGLWRKAERASRLNSSLPPRRRADWASGLTARCADARKSQRITATAVHPPMLTLSQCRKILGPGSQDRSDDELTKIRASYIELSSVIFSTFRSNSPSSDAPEFERYDVPERAAILEFEAGIPRREAEIVALRQTCHTPRRTPR